MNIFIILQLSRNLLFRQKRFSGENKESKTTILEKTQANQEI